MPFAPKSICQRCRKVGCDCKQEARRVSDRERGNSNERGYDHNWRRFRLNYLSRNAICADCQAAGIVKAAHHIHHIKKLAEHPELKYDEEWLLPLCERCHNIRTAKGE